MAADVQTPPGASSQAWFAAARENGAGPTAAAAMTALPALPQRLVFEPSADLMDGNGHMNVGNYALVFDRAFRRACEALDLRRHGLRLQTPEFHIVYLREVLMGQRLSVSLHVVALDDSRLHFTATLQDDASGAVAATYEGVAACTSIASGLPMAWPDPVRAALSAWRDRAVAPPIPVETGRAVAIRRRPGTVDAEVSTTLDGDNIVAMMDAVDFPDAIVAAQHVDEDGQLLEGWLGPLIADGMERLSRGGLGMGSMNAETLGQTAFVLESHMRAFRPVRLGDALHFEYVLVDTDDKRTHGITIARHRDEGWVVATMEQVGTCVDIGTRRSAPWHPSLRERVEAIRRAHAGRASGLDLSRSIRFEG